MDNGSHLIVLRGNSASGKSTVASELQRKLGGGTANVGQDHLRRVILREHDVPNGDNIGLLANTARYCSSLGYNVIVEGILLAAHYRDMLCDLISGHGGPTHVFYLHVTFDEALRRHRDRPLGMEVSAEQFRRWYLPSDLLGVPGETVLDATGDAALTVDAIMAAVGDVAIRAGDGSRFL